MRACLIALVLITALGCSDAAQQESLKLQRYEAATKELATVQSNLAKYENALANGTKPTPEEQKIDQENIEFAKSEIKRLQKVISENRP